MYDGCISNIKDSVGAKQDSTHASGASRPLQVDSTAFEGWITTTSLHTASKSLSNTQQAYIKVLSSPFYEARLPQLAQLFHSA